MLEEAIVAYEKVLSLKPDHESARLAISINDTLETAPREYIEKLFDGYAQKFETSLVDNLGYKTPKLIKDILTKPNPTRSLGSIVDLGVVPAY